MRYEVKVGDNFLVIILLYNFFTMRNINYVACQLLNC
jgi:hypothetical protein